MELGKIQLDSGRDLQNERRFSRYQESPAKDSFTHDLPRLALLLIMLLGAVIGGTYNYYTTRPIKIVKRSMNRTLEKPFRASLEGSSALKSVPLAFFRNRQRYTPGEGIVSETVYELGDDQKPPFDALSSLEALVFAENVVEYDREDMYGHGTRHFDGVLAMPGIGESIVYAFEYWCDIRTYRAVRMIVTKIERNVAFDDEQKSVSRETYLNIWYYD